MTTDPLLSAAYGCLVLAVCVGLIGVAIWLLPKIENAFRTRVSVRD